jgi:hypothetical protein
MKFSKGDFIAGENNTTIEIGMTVTANLDEMLVGWIKWKEGKPVEHRMVRIADGATPARRDDLGDDEPSKWEVDTNNGQLKDPWQFTNYLPLLAADGALFTFTTSSRGGLGAIGDLARRYGKHSRKHPDVFPSLRSMSIATSTATKRMAGSRCRCSRRWAGNQRPSSTKLWPQLVLLSVKLPRPSRCLPSRTKCPTKSLSRR